MTDRTSLVMHKPLANPLRPSETRSSHADGRKVREWRFIAPCLGGRSDGLHGLDGLDG